jgi:negative regulator of flagellin synthesis FlgM
MKISSERIDTFNSELIQRDLKRIKSNENESANIVSDDKVELSSGALNLKEMQAKAMSLPDVRTERVEQIKLKIDNGTYRISHEKIAEQLIDEAMGK